MNIFSLAKNLWRIQLQIFKSNIFFEHSLLSLSPFCQFSSIINRFSHDSSIRCNASNDPNMNDDLTKLLSRIFVRRRPVAMRFGTQLRIRHMACQMLSIRGDKITRPCIRSYRRCLRVYGYGEIKRRLLLSLLPSSPECINFCFLRRLVEIFVSIRNDRAE